MAGFPDTAACLGQSVCESQTGSKGTVALRPKYSVARHGAELDRAIDNSPKCFNTFSFLFISWWLLSLVSFGREFRDGIIQFQVKTRLYQLFLNALFSWG